MKLRNGGMIALLAALIGASSLALAATPPPRSTNPLAGPTQALADARANQLKAKAELDVIRKRLIPSFETKPDWKAAKDAVDAARAEMDAATKHLVAKLESDPDYKEQLSKRDKAQAPLTAARRLECRPTIIQPRFPLTTFPTLIRIASTPHTP